MTRAELVPKKFRRRPVTSTCQAWVTTIVGPADSNAQWAMPSAQDRQVVGAPTMSRLLRAASPPERPEANAASLLRFQEAFSTAKRSAYRSRRIHRLPEQHMPRAQWWSRCSLMKTATSYRRMLCPGIRC